MKIIKYTARKSLSSAIVALLVASPFCALAEESKDGDLRAAVQNPISSLVSLPFKFTFDFGATNGDASILNIQPVVPVTVGNWNLVNRAIIPIIDSPGPVAGIPSNPSPAPGNGATGLGDINYSLYFSPVDYGKVIWGVGPSITLKTATDDQLGSGKWSAGASAIALTQPSWGSVGILGRQLWSFAGDDDRADVSQFLLEPFANYNLSNGWFLITDMVATANWEAASGQVWTVPVGGGAGRVFKIGNQAINSRLEAYYNVINTDAAPDWSVSFTFQFLFPR
jgi:hypothetical protein